MSKQETAHSFDIWCALWCISAACGRAAYVARPRAPIYLNMYLVLIGDSGIVRKTTSVTTASKLVRQVFIHAPERGLLDARVTCEKLDEILHDYSHEYGSAEMCITIPELAVFLGTEQYVATMPTLLTDLYDCPAHRHGGGTIARGECIQSNVWLSFLSASTPAWLLKSVNPNVVEGGFTSRCYFVISNKPKQKIAWPDDTDTAEEAAWLLDDLKRIRKTALSAAPITLTDGALSLFSRWYKNRTHSYDPFTQSFEAREDAHVLRVAALLCINDESWCIDQAHLSKAIELVASVKHGSGEIFKGTTLRLKYSASIDAIRSILISSGMDPVPRSALVRKGKRELDYAEFNALLDVLHEAGALQRFTTKQDIGRPIEYFRGTDILLTRGLSDTVLSKFI